MKQLFLLLFCGLSIFLFCSCQSASRSKNAVEVTIAGDGRFPEILMGRWRNDRHGWQIVFEQNGRISSAVHTIGRVNIKPGQITNVPMKREGMGVFKAGQWAVQYAPETRELLVEIVLEYFRAEMGTQALEGKSRDIFIGSVSEDGQQWTAEWFAFPEYIVFTEIYDNYKLPVDYNDNPRATLVFKKIGQTK